MIMFMIYGHFTEWSHALDSNNIVSRTMIIFDYVLDAQRNYFKIIFLNLM